MIETGHSAMTELPRFISMARRLGSEIPAPVAQAANSPLRSESRPGAAVLGRLGRLVSPLRAPRNLELA